MNSSTALAEVIAFPVQGTKVCNTCDVAKPVGEFHTKKNKNGTSRLTYQCKTCEHSRKNKERGGAGDFLSLNQVRKLSLNGDLLEKRCPSCETWKVPNQCEQHGMCANRACGTEIIVDTLKGNRKKAFVDHSHSTGEVRGLLCISCNTALGLLEQKNKMLGLTEYLENYPTRIRS